MITIERRAVNVFLDLLTAIYLPLFPGLPLVPVSLLENCVDRTAMDENVDVTFTNIIVCDVENLFTLFALDSDSVVRMIRVGRMIERHWCLLSILSRARRGCSAVSPRCSASARARGFYALALDLLLALQVTAKYPRWSL